MPTTQQILTSLVVCPFIGTLIAVAGSIHHGQHIEFGGRQVPVLGICVGLAFGINWISFMPAYVLQTDKSFDVMGSLTYITIATIALILTSDTTTDHRSFLLACMVVLWAIRLGIFLLTRILRDGKDQRLDEIKPNFLRFLNLWTLQGLWVTFTSSAALISITTREKVDLDTFALIGFLVWLIGFLIEVVADYQKSTFRQNPTNKSKFISTGLWSRSRHPNYFGEITLWIGVAIVTLPTLQGWPQWIVAMFSPMFVWLLITCVSGIPLLEAKADKKWAGQTDYEHYKTNTPILIPKL